MAKIYTREFKVGDKVTILSDYDRLIDIGIEEDDPGLGEVLALREGVIEDIGVYSMEEDLPYKVRFRNGDFNDYYSFGEDDLALSTNLDFDATKEYD